MKQTTRTWTNDERLTIFSQGWLPEGERDALKSGVKDLVIILHGLGEHSDRYQAWAKRFVDAGMAVYALDLPGHGRTAGRRGHARSFGAIFDDIKHLIARCRQDHPAARIHFYGHSMGGAITLGYATIRRDDAVAAGVTSLTLSGPAIRPGFEPPVWKIKLAALLERLAPGLTLPSGLDPDWLSTNPSVISAYKADPLVHDMISVRWYNDWMRTLAAVEASAAENKFPVLVMHAGDDQATSPAASEKMARLLKARFHLFPGARHEIHHESCADDAFRMALSFMQGA